MGRRGRLSRGQTSSSRGIHNLGARPAGLRAPLVYPRKRTLLGSGQATGRTGTVWYFTVTTGVPEKEDVVGFRPSDESYRDGLVLYGEKLLRGQTRVASTKTKSHLHRKLKHIKSPQRRASGGNGKTPLISPTHSAHEIRLEGFRHAEAEKAEAVYNSFQAFFFMKRREPNQRPKLPT